MQGPKTHEQQLRILERKRDGGYAPAQARPRKAAARQSEFPVSRTGMNQESQHNKHNHAGQAGHRPKPLKSQQDEQDS